MKETRTSDKVFNKIQEKILSGEWSPGTKIMSEPQLAKELEVSRVSVREAIEKLVTLNVITKKQGGGSYVNELKPSNYFNRLLPMILLDKENYIDILEFRLITEPETTKLCTERCSEELIKELEECYDLMLAYKDDIEKFTEQDLNFHMKIAEGSGNTLMIKVNEILRNVLEYHQISLYKLLGPSGGVREHKMILDAMKSKDSELASLLIKRHIERTISDLKNK